MSEPVESAPAAASREGITTISAPSPLRLAGFLATVLGALGLGVGAVLTWITVPLPQGLTGNGLDVIYKGLDLVAGKVAIGSALVLLIGLMALRGARTRTGEKIIAVIILIAALAGLAGALFTILTADSRYGLADQTTVTRGFGVFLAAAGGVVGALGGFLDILWAWAPISPPAGEDPDAGSGVGA